MRMSPPAAGTLSAAETAAHERIHASDEDVTSRGRSRIVGILAERTGVNLWGAEASSERREHPVSGHSTRRDILKGGLAAWKAMGYSVVPYEQPFHLDTRT